MLVVGFDLSLSDTGWAVVEFRNGDFRVVKHGHIPTIKRKGKMVYPTGRRLQKIYKSISRIIEEYNPDVITREASFSNGNNLSTQQIFKVNGVFEMTMHQYNKEKSLEVYAPSTIKKTITGNGRSSKDDVANTIFRLTDMRILNDNMTDAIGVALTYGIKNNLYEIKE